MNEKISLCIFILLLLAGCKSRYEPTVEEAGIIVEGFNRSMGYKPNGSITNMNNFPVRIRQVWIFKGETTQWVKVFEPYETKIQSISYQHGWHIYTLDGIEIGWLRYKLRGTEK